MELGAVPTTEPPRQPSPSVPVLPLGGVQRNQSNNHWVTPTVTPRDIDILPDVSTPVQLMPVNEHAEQDDRATVVSDPNPALHGQARASTSGEYTVSEGLRPILMALAAAAERDAEVSCLTSLSQQPEMPMCQEFTALPIPSEPAVLDHAEEEGHSDTIPSLDPAPEASAEPDPALMAQQGAPASPAHSSSGEAPDKPPFPPDKPPSPPDKPPSPSSSDDQELTGPPGSMPVKPRAPRGVSELSAALDLPSTSIGKDDKEGKDDPNTVPPPTGRLTSTTGRVRRASFAPMSPTTANQTRTSGVSRSSLASAASVLGRSLSRSFTHMVMGDDHQVQDKWDNDADLNPDDELMLRRSISMSMAAGGNSMKLPSSGNMSFRAASRRGSASGKVHPMSASSSRRFGSESGVFSVSVADILHEKKSARILLWGYFQALMISILVAAVCIPLVTVLSLVPWHENVAPRRVNATLPPAPPVPSYAPTPAPAPAPAGDAANPPAASLVLPYIIRPNNVALQWMLLAQLIFPLIIYALLLFVCIRRTFRLPLLLIGAVAFTLVWSCVACALLYRYDVAFWFYYIDLFMIVAAFVPCMAVVGWYVESDEEAPMALRIKDTLVTAILETIVAAATLVYCLFLMPAFFMLTSGWLQVLWLCVLHPLYFEITTGFVVRKVLHRNRALGRNHIVYFLSIVHSVVHTVALATSLQASIEPVKVLALTVFLYNVSKLFWRSTVMQRDLLVEKLVHGWSFTYSDEEKAELARMVSVGILTEIVLENASILITPYMMYRMYKEPIFMAVVPNTFFFQDGTYPVKSLVVMIFIFMAFTITFDLIFYFLNYHAWQCLPLINTWRRIKAAGGWYISFLIYAFACMGILFLFLTMMILPRAAYCKSNDYCDCVTPAYENICEGRYNSLMVDYLIDPYDT